MKYPETMEHHTSLSSILSNGTDVGLNGALGGKYKSTNQRNKGRNDGLLDEESNRPNR